MKTLLSFLIQFGKFQTKTHLYWQNHDLELVNMLMKNNFMNSVVERPFLLKLSNF